MEAAGIPVRITFTYRSPETQHKLHVEGKSKVDFGWHNVGLAFDFLPRSSQGYRFPQPSDPPTLVQEISSLLRRGGEIGEAMGMVWGGRWDFKDEFHLEWHPRLTIAQAKQKYLANGPSFQLAA